MQLLAVPCCEGYRNDIHTTEVVLDTAKARSSLVSKTGMVEAAIHYISCFQRRLPAARRELDAGS